MKLKKKAYRSYLSCRNSDNANGSRMAKSYAAVGIANAKIQVWEAFGEVTQKDFSSKKILTNPQVPQGSKVATSLHGLVGGTDA